jgi:hypothetical protein
MTTSTADTTEITRSSSEKILSELLEEAEQLEYDLATTSDPAQRAVLYRRAAINQEREALTHELRRGRTRDKQSQWRDCRIAAQVLATAAIAEDLRARAGEHDRELPPPMALLCDVPPYVHPFHVDEVCDSLLALYSAAAGHDTASG